MANYTEQSDKLNELQSAISDLIYAYEKDNPPIRGMILGRCVLRTEEIDDLFPIGKINKHFLLIP